MGTENVIQSAARGARRPNIRVQQFIAKLPMFGELTEIEIDRIAAGTNPVYAEKGEAVVQRGDPCVGFHVVVYGQIKLGFTSAQGAEKVVEIIGPGQSFGEALMFLDKSYIVFAQALADSMLLHVSKRTVFEEIERDPRFAHKVISGLSRRLHGLVKDVETYSLKCSAERVIGYLLREEAGRGNGEGGMLEIELSAGKSVIASRLNMTPEHFSRVLHDLSQAGLISVDGRMVRVHDLERLRASRF
jgi:CRP-like cAMP-binding protein